MDGREAHGNTHSPSHYTAGIYQWLHSLQQQRRWPLLWSCQLNDMFFGNRKHIFLFLFFFLPSLSESISSNRCCVSVYLARSMSGCGHLDKLNVWNNKCSFPIFKKHLWASLVAQWLRIRLPMQGTQVRALVWEDPTCHGATKPVCHNYWACTLEPMSHNYWARVPQLLKPACLEPMLCNKRSHRNKKPVHCHEE